MKRVLVLLAVLVPASSAHAAIPFTPCTPDGIECATLSVPLDRSGGVPGTVDLAVYRAPAHGPSKGVLLGLPGGPGGGALAFFQRRMRNFQAARATHDLVFVDPRGAGRSSPLRCDDAASCVADLGPATRLYTSRHVAEDLEAVRDALEVDKVALYGLSYGAWFAQTYARLYPDRVAALALDSPIARAQLENPFELDDFAALPGALRALCPPAGCARDPYDTAIALAPRLDQTALARIAAAGGTLDVNPASRAELGAALAARLRGDAKPLDRLIIGTTLPPRDIRERFNPGINVVVQCEERVMPWDRATPADQRLAIVQQKLGSIPDSAFAPFDRSFGLTAGMVPACLGWPEGSQSPLVDGDLPPVPKLVLAGEADIRIRPADSRDLATAIGARFVQIGDLGHGALQEDPTGCGGRALAALINAGAIAPCGEAGLAPRPPFARRMNEVPGVTRGKKIANAAVLTATDAINQAAMRVDAQRRDVPVVSFAGLRGGRVRGTELRVTLDDAEWVGGLAVSGIGRADGRHDLRLTGSARGRLRVRGQRYRGRIDGAKVRGTLDLRAVGGTGRPVADVL